MGDEGVWYFMPRTNLGRWSAWLLAAFFLLFIIFNILVASGQTGGDTFSDNLYLSIPAVIAAFCAISAFITGIISIIWEKEGHNRLSGYRNRASASVFPCRRISVPALDFSGGPKPI